MEDAGAGTGRRGLSRPRRGQAPLRGLRRRRPDPAAHADLDDRHARFWKAQVPYLARHFRVVTYDGPGNGRSDRPLEPGPYGWEEQGRSALAVLDATGTERAVLVSLSMASQWALWLMA